MLISYAADLISIFWWTSSDTRLIGRDKSLSVRGIALNESLSVWDAESFGMNWYSTCWARRHFDWVKSYLKRGLFYVKLLRFVCIIIELYINTDKRMCVRFTVKDKMILLVGQFTVLVP